MYIHFNGNPCGKDTIDCVIRAISIAAEMPWRKVYAGLSVFGYIGCTWGNVNEIWGRYMAYLGYKRHRLPYDPAYTAADFAADHPHGRYVLGTGAHAVAVVDGCIVDSWDSRHTVPRYYFTVVSEG